MFSLTSIQLDTLQHCNGVGTESVDKTIGEYLSGFWENHIDTNALNYLRIECANIPQDSLQKLFGSGKLNLKLKTSKRRHNGFKRLDCPCGAHVFLLH